MTLRLLMVLMSSSLSVALAGGAGAEMKWPEFPADVACTPAIPNSTLHLGTHPDSQASVRMKAMYDADQADRVGEIDWDKVTPRDLLRRKTTLELLRRGQLSSGADLLGAAFVFQHGNCPNHYLLANVLADQALKRGNQNARFIFAATYDRWLVSLGKPQKYGTQLPGLLKKFDAKGKLVSCEIIEIPTDPHTTDAELARYGLPLGAQREQNAARTRQDYLKTCPANTIKDNH